MRYGHPRKTPPGGELRKGDKKNNAVISGLRTPVERLIAHFKSWRVFHTDYRRPYRTYREAYNATRGLFFFSITWGLNNVLNTERTPKQNYLRLHRATCRTITILHPNADGGRFTTSRSAVVVPNWSYGPGTPSVAPFSHVGSACELPSGMRSRSPTKYEFVSRHGRRNTVHAEGTQSQYSITVGHVASQCRMSHTTYSM